MDILVYTATELQLAGTEVSGVVVGVGVGVGVGGGGIFYMQISD